MRRIFLSFILAIMLTIYNSEIASSVKETTYTEPLSYQYILSPLKIESLSIENKPVESIKPTYKTFEVTAYTSGYESTGKYSNHPQYNVTASGNKVKENYTVSCPKSMPFGTKLYIPYFDNVFTCEDRGSAITEGHLDIYMKKYKDAMDFGRQKLEILIIKLDES